MAFSQDVRNRNLFWINVSTFSWNLGLGASIPVVPLLAYQFVPDLALAGLVVAIGGAARLFSGYLTGPLVDRFGRLGVVRIGVFLRMVFSFMEGLSGGYLELVTYRFFSSVGTSVYGTGVTVMMADIATRRDRGRLAGGRTSLAQLGNVFGPAVGAALWAATGDLRAPFLFNGCTKLVCMIIFLFCVKETQGYQKEDEAAARASAPAPAASTTPVPAAAATTTALEFGLRQMLFTGPFFLTLFAAFSAALFQQGVQNTVLAVFLKEVLARDKEQIGVVLTSISLGQLLMGFPVGWMVDRWGVRAGLLPGSILASATLAYLAFTADASIPWALVMGAGYGMVSVTASAYAMDIAPAHARGHFFGINQGAVSGANLAGPLILGFFIDHFGYGWGFGVIALLIAAVAPMSLVWVRDVRARREAGAEAGAGR
jgi:MFS family permease